MQFYMAKQGDNGVCNGTIVDQYITMPQQYVVRPSIMTPIPRPMMVTP